MSLQNPGELIKLRASFYADIWNAYRAYIHKRMCKNIRGVKQRTAERIFFNWISDFSHSNSHVESIIYTYINTFAAALDFPFFH